MSGRDAPSPNQTREPLAVRLVRFREPMDAPGLSVASSCTASDQSNRKRHSIQYLPWMRHFRIEFFPGGEGATQVAYIHEAHIKSWEPLE